MKLRYEMILNDELSLPSTNGRGDGVINFIPGSMILGAVASSSYQTALEQDLAWDLFHSGVVSFGDALLIDPRSGVPMTRTPLSIHHVKKANIEEDENCDFFNLAHVAPSARLHRDEGDSQLEQTRGMITSTGWFDKPKWSYSLKTSIELKTQKAKEGMLFGHSHLSAGQRFGFTVLIDDSHPRCDELKTLVQEALSEHVRIGKSRSAEFGGVGISECTRSVEQWSECEPDENVQELALVQHPERSELRLQSYVLLSETCLIDPRSGEPTLTPHVQHLGLDPTRFTIELEYCFIRSTRWTPFNTYRARQDLERIALVGGSVITVSATQTTWAELDLDGHLRTLARGIGDHTAEGMGRIKSSHVLLSAIEEIKARRQRSLSEAQSKKNIQVKQTLPQDELGAWMAKRRETEVYHELALSIALELLKPVGERQTKGAIDLTPLVKGSKGLPSRSQWRNVEMEARRYLMKNGGLNLLRTNLLEPTKEGIRGSGGLLIRGTSKDLWGLEGKGDEAVARPSAIDIRKKPGLAIMALLNEQSYEPFVTELSTLRVATERRLSFTGHTKHEQRDVNRFVINFLAPLVLTFVSRVIAARLQKSDRTGDK